MAKASQKAGSYKRIYLTADQSEKILAGIDRSLRGLDLRLNGANPKRLRHTESRLAELNARLKYVVGPPKAATIKAGIKVLLMDVQLRRKMADAPHSK